jgi:hypothetical protein
MTRSSRSGALARDQAAPSPPLNIGLNLIFLVPGETGGMEVAARELIPALLAEASPGVRFTAFINREAAAAKDGPWGELLPAVTVPVNARNRVQWVFGEQTLLPPLAMRVGVEPREHRAALGALSQGRDRARSDLRALPGGACGHPRQGHEGVGAPGGSSFGQGDRRFKEHAR